ncbi:MAG: DUF2764 domain-containing protein [Candidatus Omnitrophica bacterium]|nr:DUF2764 domain-containing protein [Candidatus Omnitrophota bacterium]
MPRFYTYLMSSLPSLQFGQKPPFSFERFLALCSEFIPEPDSAVLRKLDLSYNPENFGKEILKKIILFETCLRNEIARIRAGKRRIDASRYIRKEAVADLTLAHTLVSISRNTHPLETEKALDKLRWDFLEALSFGHYFDFEALLIYAYKLLILEKWEKIDSADKKTLLAEVLNRR